MSREHAGEQEVQRRAGEGGPGWGSPMFDGEVGVFGRFLRRQRLVAISGATPDGAMWSTVLTGDEGFIDVPDDRTMVIHALPPVGDPLRDAFDEPADIGSVVMAPQALRRVKVAGTAQREGDRLVVHTEQVLGNCPKYLQLRSVVEEQASASPEATASRELSLDQQALIRTADTFFIGSRASGHGADANHRGGQPGFVTVLDERRISWPDYVGNSFFMTLGNLQLDPRSGLVFLDWQTGRTLQLTGTSRINWDGADRTVEFEVAGVVDIEHASSLRWQLHAYSRFNPPA
ncbi:pyridoxamine 5'-phosphate oxidase family protein [Actinoplanes solisilvae]|uniref:pyridoxamine 5'-phosphate oxidase family protein n=1 Tax=Actinoplanes solisilvae TaxID=2486853 RepID=UPI000FD8CED7|nr:pyridoxamine 5'-phosphate oxidase family protein [Actinoplanes solisilvae]